MPTQTIYHKTRTRSFTLNFPSTENNLSWSITVENDGEFYDVVLSNIATYSINGVAQNISPTNTYSLTAGTSYGISITKTTNGQSSSITFKSRRAIDKTTSISVPDYGLYNGRYLYILKSNGIVEKHDTSLFTPANYAGAGVWTSMTLVSTITLPTLPNTAKYSTITFVKNGGVEKMLVHGCEINAYKCYASFIRLSDDTVWNLNFTTQNTYTQTVNSTAIYNSTYLKCAFYDYVSEKVIFHTTSGSQGYGSYSLDLTTLTPTLFTYSSSQQELIANYSSIFPNYHRSCSILPTESRYLNAITKFDFSPATFCAIKSLANTKNVVYNRNINAIFSYSDNSINRVREYNVAGNLLNVYQFSTGTISGQQPILGYNSNNNEYILIAQAVTNNNYSIYKKTAGTGAGYILQSPASGSTFGVCLMKSYYNNNWYITGNLSSGLRRLTVINSGQSTPDFGYLDVNNDIYDLATTQIYD